MIIKTQDCETLVLNPSLIYMDQIQPSVYSIYAKINGGEITLGKNYSKTTAQYEIGNIFSLYCEGINGYIMSQEDKTEEA